MTLTIRALFAAGILSLTCCVKKNLGSLDYGLKVEDTLRVNLGTEPPSIDWGRSSDTVSGYVTENLMDGLVGLDLSDPELKLLPALATEWRASEKARIWTFKIRQGVKWSDGVPFTGQQIVDAWERVLNPKTASEYAYYLFAIKGARAYNAGKLKDFKDVGVRMTDKGELRVELEKPMGYFPSLTSHTPTFPIRKDIIEKYGDQWTEPGKLVTLGPYVLKGWEHDQTIWLERFDDYYGDKAKVKNVLGYMINEFSTALNLMDGGRLDVQLELPTRELPVLRTKPGYRKVTSLMMYYLGFNTRKAPFNDVRVRKAFTYAVDRKQVTDLLAAGHAPLTGWIPIGMLGYENQRGLQFDPALGRHLLDEAGYKDRSKIKVTLAFNTNENHQRIAENVQAQLKKNLGVEIQLANEEWKVYLRHLGSDTPNMYRMAWVADYPDPATFANLMTSTSDTNFTGWKSKRYDELESQASESLDREKRRGLYSQMQKLLVEDEVPVLPVYTAVDHLMLSDRIKDFPLSPTHRFPFHGVTFK